MDIKEKIEKINAIVSKENWYDMEVLEWDGFNLTVAGSLDFTYNHTLEIVFKEVYHVSINEEWMTDTSKPMLYIIQNEDRPHYVPYAPEGYLLFEIVPEDANIHFYIIAKNLDFNTDRVLYYKKEKLEEGERYAEWFLKKMAKEMN